MSNDIVSSRYTNRYEAFNRVVGVVMDMIQSHTWEGTGKTMRRVEGDQEAKLRLSVEQLVSDSVALVWQRKRKGEASIDLGKDRYGKG
ncbi:hypothetical protein, partial [Loktanella sp. SALINAS62]|uniref:hypothetical protein n=1 Tax=Loktanella sp. SALINAS62 TaxID=2706124 RepID=UPI001B8C875D